MTKKNNSAFGTGIPSETGKALRLELPPKAIGIAAAAFMVLATGSALAEDFDVISLKPGEARQVVVWAENPYLRICNDMISASTVAVDVGRRAAEALPPGKCATDDIANAFGVVNKGTGPAMVTYRAINLDRGGEGG